MQLIRAQAHLLEPNGLFLVMFAQVLQLKSPRLKTFVSARHVNVALASS